MGLHSTVLVLSDALGDIASDPEFGRKLADTISGRTRLRRVGLAGRVSCGGSCAAVVVETHHADVTAVVALGGNCATVLGAVRGADHHTAAGQLAILKALASELGYELAPKPVTRRKRTIPGRDGKAGAP